MVLIRSRLILPSSAINSVQWDERRKTDRNNRRKKKSEIFVFLWYARWWRGVVVYIDCWCHDSWLFGSLALTPYTFRMAYFDVRWFVSFSVYGKWVKLGICRYMNKCIVLYRANCKKKKQKTFVFATNFLKLHDEIEWNFRCNFNIICCIKLNDSKRRWRGRRWWRSHNDNDWQWVHMVVFGNFCDLTS